VLASSSAVTTATALRIGVASASLLVRRTPTLMRLAASASAGGDGRAQAVFRDEFIGLYREVAEQSWHELRRGLDDLDAATRTGTPTGTGTPPRTGDVARAKRPYRVKA
jgi:hypothetical protein